MKISLVGHFMWKEYDPRTRLWVPVHVVENQITDIGLELIVALLGGGQGDPEVGGDTLGTGSDYQDFTIQEMQITDQTTPTAPDAGDTALEGTAVWTADRDGAGDGTLNYTYGANYIEVDTLIGATSAIDGTVLTEQGLFNVNNRLLARATSEYEKTNGQAVTPTWRWTFTLE